MYKKSPSPESEVRINETSKSQVKPSYRSNFSPLPSAFLVCERSLRRLRDRLFGQTLLSSSFVQADSPAALLLVNLEQRHRSWDLSPP